MVKEMNKGLRFVFFTMLLPIASCNFLDVDSPKSQVPADLIFTSDLTATAAMVGVYLDMQFESNLASGTNNAIVSLGGLSADELVNLALDPESLQFQNNDLMAENSKIEKLWNFSYRTIYQCNSILEGLNQSTAVSQTVENQLRGEALFIRAFYHFYLINCFGDVPLITSTDYKINGTAPRTPMDDVYDQVVEDLQEAESLLGESYVTAGRVRPNKFTATALMSRVYLYKEDWARAEDRATNVIVKKPFYDTTSLNNVFLSSSIEAIWQLRVPEQRYYTHEGHFFGTSQGHRYNLLNPLVLDAFESNDRRRTSWVISQVVSGQTLYYPNKYKKQSGTTESNEYSTVLRLAEQYLIRAEARARQDKLPLAIADLDVIRKRARLPLIQNTNPSISKDDLLLAIEQERRIEFLVEWGHRWFDLKRTNRATAILSPLKPGWTSDDELYPLPSLDLRNNPNLRPQNPGY